MKQRLRSMPHKKVSSNLVHTFVDISFMYKIGTMLSFDLRTCQLVSLCGPKFDLVPPHTYAVSEKFDNF